MFLLDSDVTFLNHGSFGACPRAVFETYQRWQRELEREPVDFIVRQLPELLDEAREALGAYLGVGSAELTFVPNATTGVNMAVRAIALQPGDEVLTTDMEYGACLLTLQRYCTVVEAPVERLFEFATERTRAVFVSHVTSATSLLLPIERIVTTAKSLGLVSIVDGAHAVAHVDLDLRRIGADFYVGNCHKWLCAPKGSGFLYVSSEWRDRVDGAIVSWGYDEPASFLSRTTLQGTRDSAAYLTVPAAIEFVEEHWDRARCVTLAQEACRDLCAALGTAPISVEPSPLQMVTVPLPVPRPHLSEQLFAAYKIEVPVVSNGEAIRVSVATYNEREDVRRLLDALEIEGLAR